MDESCFAYCSLKSICIPSCVEILGKLCFYSGSIGGLTFGPDSRLKQIEEPCFAGCSLAAIQIPREVVFRV
jgi:hypothetical protein